MREPATVPEQVDGLQQSDDILRLLPPELATLGITELEFEFYRKLVEKQLLTYRLHGDAWKEKITERPVTRQTLMNSRAGRLSSASILPAQWAVSMNSAPRRFVWR